MDLDELVVDTQYELGGSDDERERLQHAVVTEQLERNRRMRTMAVPTDDKKVRERLRAFGEPITLFGEGPGDRRDRLKIVQERYETQQGRTLDTFESDSSGSEDEGEFYTEGSNALLAARQAIARYSLQRAKKRIERQSVEINLPLGKILNVRKEVFGQLQTFNNLGSQFGDDRPLSTIRFSPNSKLLLTTSWTGAAKVWALPSLNEIAVRRGHVEKVGGAAWHPQATIGLSESAANFVTGGGEGEVKLWSLNQDKALATLSGHANRVGRVGFHPSGAFVGSASFDGTWRLWDVEKQAELLVQEGHSKEVIALAFQDDGALVATGGFDAIGRVWDIRTGRTAMVLDGHAKEILSMDFAPNGFQVATGSGDNTVRIWDLRALRSQHTIPAHSSSVSDLKFYRAADENPFVGFNSLTDNNDMEVDEHGEMRAENDNSPSPIDLPRSGLFLVTAGFDCNVRIWSADEWARIRNLATDAGKVMSADISPDGKFIASASYSRSFHLFGGEHSLS